MKIDEARAVAVSLLTPKVVGGLLVAAAIAWLAPFDKAFDAATLGIPALRSAMMVALALIGLVIAHRVGLGVEPTGLKHPIVTPIVMAFLVAVWCWGADWFLRSGANHDYLQFMTGEILARRMFYFVLRAFNENILYRLFLGSALVWLFGLVWRTNDKRPTRGAYCVGFLLSQVCNIWINVTSWSPITPFGLLHDTVRYVAPALVWSWLYWRHGFQSNEIACTTVHVFFQPLSGIRII